VVPRSMPTSAIAAVPLVMHSVPYDENLRRNRELSPIVSSFNESGSTTAAVKGRGKNDDLAKV
jgi:hypothetical protein